MGIIFHLSPQSRPEPRPAAHGRPSRRRGMVPFCRRRWGRPRTWKREWRSRLRGLEFDLFFTEKIGARAAMVELAPGGLSANARRQPRCSPQGGEALPPVTWSKEKTWWKSLGTSGAGKGHEPDWRVSTLLELDVGRMIIGLGSAELLRIYDPGTSTECKQASSGAGLRLSKVSSGLSSNGSPNPGTL
uniref:Uncharacterized protein n=1 Tax=Oryza glumipatula TaxID=40148 RepID=A0A0D9ZXI0_9ORYZ